MTIGIGVLCHYGEAIIIASDTRGSYGGSNPAPSHENLSKQLMLPMGFAATIAGCVSDCEDMVGNITSQMQGILNIEDKYHDHIRKAMHDAQYTEYVRRVDHRMKMELGITILEWKSMEQTRKLYQDGLRILNETDIDAQCIIGGFLGENPVLLSMQFKERAEIVTLHQCIGSGANAAAEVLNERCQSQHQSFLRTLVHVAEGLVASRSRYVGNPADYLVLLPNGVTRRFPCNDPAFLSIVDAYADKDTAALDLDIDGFEEIKKMLYVNAPEIITRSASQKLAGQQ